MTKPKLFNLSNLLELFPSASPAKPARAKIPLADKSRYRRMYAVEIEIGQWFYIHKSRNPACMTPELKDWLISESAQSYYKYGIFPKFWAEVGKGAVQLVTPQEN